MNIIIEKRIKRIEILILATLIILVGSIVMQIRTQHSINDEVLSDLPHESKMLPSELDRDKLNHMVYLIKEGYINEQYRELYDILGSYALSQISPDEIDLSFDKISLATGKIETYTYSHYVYNVINEGAEWFMVYYKCRFGNGKGTIKLSFRNADDSPEVAGLFINLEEL